MSERKDAVTPFHGNKKVHGLWKAHKTGAFNHVWTSPDDFDNHLIADNPGFKGPYVYKKPRKEIDASALEEKLPKSSRAVRIWKEVHKKPAVSASLYRGGWVAPFFAKSRNASDSESAQEVLRIYNRTGRIFLDAPTEGNILMTPNPEKSDKEATAEVARTVDMDLLVKRSGSPTYTEKELEAYIKKTIQPYLEDKTLSILKPKTVEVIKNLLYLDEHINKDRRPELSFKVVMAITCLRKVSTPISIELIEALNSFSALGVSLTDAIVLGLSGGMDSASEAPEEGDGASNLFNGFSGT